MSRSQKSRGDFSKRLEYDNTFPVSRTSCGPPPVSNPAIVSFALPQRKRAASGSEISYTSAVDRDLAFARLSDLLPIARERFGVRELAVFGSVARGEASATSDLDVLVDFVGLATFDGFMGLKLFLEDSLGVKVDLVTRAALKPRLRSRIEAEARRVA